jgi:UPF0755 protein
MSEDQQGFAPEPNDENPGAGVPEYAAGDTGTRAVPVGTTSDDEPEETEAYEAPAEPSDEPLLPVSEEPAVYPGGARRAAPRRSAGSSRRRGRGVPGCVAVLVALVVVLAIAWVGGSKGYHFLKDHIGNSAADYAGPGTGSVTFEVHKGDSATEIGRNLKAAGVVESVQAFIDAANADSRSGGIQVGYYQLKKQMKASAALAVLVDPKSLIQSLVVVPEGARVEQIVDTIVAKTSIKRSDVIAALKSPQLGLPAAANGNPEGYLFPATYSVVPGETAIQLLKQMVAKSAAVDSSLHLDTAAAKVGLTPEQVVTVASILEYEAKRPEDYPKVARTIYNRLKAGMPLQSDATVSYASHVSGEVWTTESMRSNESPYNTYQHTGLPPGPIGNPGETTLKAALAPADGSWLYWVVVNLKTGETVFSNTLAEHNAAVEQFKQYCTTSSAC